MLDQSRHQKSDSAVRIWILSLCALMVLLIVIGGITRLTHSGLSIVQWKPVSGIIPPLNRAQWQEAFAQYQRSPEYRLVNAGMSLSQFQLIFLWEFVHRFLARMIGFVLVLPWIFFAIRRRISPWLTKRLAFGIFLGGIQGGIGWFMVASGLVDRPSVSHYRLATHLVMGLLILSYFFWIWLSLRKKGNDPEPIETAGRSRLSALLFAFMGTFLVQVVFGAFTAGLHAGLIFNTFPKMEGDWIPLRLFGSPITVGSFFENPAAVQWTHRLFGTLLLFLSVMIFIAAGGTSVTEKQRRRLRILGAFVLIQFLLGVETLLHSVPIPLAAIHQLGACAVLLSGLAAIHEMRPAVEADLEKRASRPFALAVFLIALLPGLSSSAFGFGAAHPSAPGVPDPYNSFRWNGTDRDWYEWWYYKAVIPETNEAILFTYGIVNPADIEGKNPASGAHLSFGMLNSGEYVEEILPVSAFHASADHPSVTIGANTATDRRITGSLRASDGRLIRWDISIEQDWKFNAMGWATRVDGISNIYWYPAQASAWMDGWVDLGGRRIALHHSPAYQDRNWGTSFPKWWTWLVSNHFENSPGTVLASGGGKPTVLNTVNLIDGFTIGLRHQGREYVFRSTDGDPILAKISFGTWELEAMNFSGQRITISAFAPQDHFVVLPFITPQGPTFYDYEALLGDIRVKLYQGNELIADLLTHEGGIEYGSFDHYGLDQLFKQGMVLR